MGNQEVVDYLNKRKEKVPESGQKVLDQMLGVTAFTAAAQEVVNAKSDDDTDTETKGD
jgi:hypothetical protein